MILAGIEEADTVEDVEWLSNKIVQLRIFNDENGIMNLSVSETGGDIIVVSQSLCMQKPEKGTGPHTSKLLVRKKQYRCMTCLYQNSRNCWENL
jgi:D-tyrosyl-tRNA(Tyr) deacylase